MGRQSLSEMGTLLVPSVLSIGVTCVTLALDEIGVVLGPSDVGLRLTILVFLVTSPCVRVTVVLGVRHWFLLEKSLEATPMTLKTTSDPPTGVLTTTTTEYELYMDVWAERELLGEQFARGDLPVVGVEQYILGSKVRKVVHGVAW